jgi:hypothetical protein
MMVGTCLRFAASTVQFAREFSLAMTESAEPLSNVPTLHERMLIRALLQ